MKDIEVTIHHKLDHNLSKNELHQIFLVYDECFYNGQVCSAKQILLAKKWLGKSKTWHWFFAKNAKNGKVVGIAAYCYSYKNAQYFEIRPDRNENICSVGVLPKFRKMGIGRLLMEAIISYYGSKNDLVVEIKSDNRYEAVLLKFYQSLGFRELSVEPKSTFLILYQSNVNESST